MSPEFQLQKSICQLLDAAYPGLVYFSVPSGAVLAWSEADRARGKRKWAKLRVTGAKVGVADIIVIGPRGRCLGLEVKSPIGRQSPDQKRFERELRAAGGDYAMVRRPEDVEVWLSLWGVPRGRRAA